jgi:hypothetical protein
LKSFLPSLALIRFPPGDRGVGGFQTRSSHFCGDSFSCNFLVFWQTSFGANESSAVKEAGLLYE